MIDYLHRIPPMRAAPPMVGNLPLVPSGHPGYLEFGTLEWADAVARAPLETAVLMGLTPDQVGLVRGLLATYGKHLLAYEALSQKIAILKAAGPAFEAAAKGYEDLRAKEEAKLIPATAALQRTVDIMIAAAGLKELWGAPTAGSSGYDRPVDPWKDLYADLAEERKSLDRIGRIAKDLGFDPARDGPLGVPTGAPPGSWTDHDLLREMGDLLRGILSGGLAQGGLPGGPGITGSFADLSRAPGANSMQGDRAAAWTPSVSSSSSSSSTNINTDTSKTSKPDGAGDKDSPYAYEGWDGTTTNVYIYEDPGLPAKKISPDPVGEVVSLSRDPFIAAQQAKALGFAGRTISTPNGPVLAFPPDGGASPTGDTTGTIEWEMLDPVAPVAIYEGGSFGPRGAGPSRTRFDNPFIEALWPEGSGRGEREDPLAVLSAISGRPMPAPETPSDPAASMRFGANVVAVAGVAGGPTPAGGTTGAVLVEYSAGVTSPTIVTAAGRAMGFRSSR